MFSVFTGYFLFMALLTISQPLSTSPLFFSVTVHFVNAFQSLQLPLQSRMNGINRLPTSMQKATAAYVSVSTSVFRVSTACTWRAWARRDHIQFSIVHFGGATPLDRSSVDFFLAAIHKWVTSYANGALNASARGTIVAHHLRDLASLHQNHILPNNFFFLFGNKYFTMQ